MRIHASGMLLLAVAASACGNDATSTGPTASVFTVLQPAPAVVVPGYPLLDSIVIRVLDQRGWARKNFPVSWVARQTGASVSPGLTFTDSTGRVAVRWTPGVEEGEQQLEARTPDDSLLLITTQASVFRSDRVVSQDERACGVVDGNLWCLNRSVVTPAVSGGLTTTTQRRYRAPAMYTSVGDITDLAMGSAEVCTLTTAAKVICYSTQWNDGPPPGTEIAVPPARAISGGGVFATFCALAAADSTAWCWNPEIAPAQVPSSGVFLDLRVSTRTLCGRRTDLTMACWGRFSSVTSGSTTPVVLDGGRQYSHYGVGNMIACGLSTAGEVYCWGDDDGGEVFLVGTFASGPPKLVTSSIQRLTLNNRRVLALRNNLPVRWGGGFEGPPVFPAGLEGLAITTVPAAGDACLLTTDRQVHCYEMVWVNGSFSAPSFRYRPMPPIQPE